MNRLSCFINGFPKELAADVEYVCEWIQMHAHTKHDVFQEYSEWKLSNKEIIKIPYRMYETDILFPTSLNDIQVIIYHCIYTRNDNGYIRERHVKALIENEPPEWVYPYILKVCNEYVMEILELVYQNLHTKDCTKWKSFCLLNQKTFVYSYQRMTSYWNEYYRSTCYLFHDYIGRKLFWECFGYTRALEKKS